MEKILIKYLNQFKKLNRGFTKGLGRAPHKPVLLLSIIQLIKAKVITSNRIFITPELVLAFKSNWNDLVDTGHTSNFSLPFFHLRSEPFWNLVSKPGKQVAISKSKSVKSFKNLKDTIAYAEIDRELFQLLENDETLQILEKFLLSEYFGLTSYSLSSTPKLELDLEFEILNEDKEVYKQRIEHIQKTQDENNIEEELFARGGVFKKVVPKIYGYSCCISGMKIQSTSNAQMVDACHIVPFSVSNNDTIQNGISLSPNLHRAFDRGLITINKDFIVRVSPTIEDNNSVYSISQFEGNQIKLPSNPNYYPSSESLIWHTKEVFQL